MITSYNFIATPEEGWEFEEIKLKKINLLVGASGSGKTRFLNTFYNFAEMISKGIPFRPGKWKLKLKISEIEYDWEYEGGKSDDDNLIVKYEKLIQTDSTGNKLVLIDRNQDLFNFKDEKLPKLEPNIPSVTLLQHEELINPIYKTFSHVQRRRFDESYKGNASVLDSIDNDKADYFTKNKDLNRLWGSEYPVQLRLYIFQKYFPDLFELSINYFKQIFPTIKGVEIKFVISPALQINPGHVTPIVMFKEKEVKSLIPYNQLSSGMQKVLLIITDVLSLPGDTVYIIDEYENSLGVNAIDFLPQLLIDHGGNNQFLITTHHPYLINSMPIDSWLVFNRKGSTVRIKSGIEFEEKFGKSKQKLFIQLLNDPFYSEGTE